MGLSTPTVNAAASVVEIHPAAGRWVDVSLAKRLVVLELSEVDVPLPVGARSASERPGLYVRVFSEPSRLTVEMWDRGELQGVRRLGLRGSPELISRRVALAAGDLAERLREARLRAQRNARRLRQKQQRQASAAPLVVRGAFVLNPRFDVGYSPTGQHALLGPRLAAGVQFVTGPELALSGALLALESPLSGESRPWLSWYELAVHPGFAFTLQPGSSFYVGAKAAVATVHAKASLGRGEATADSEQPDGSANADSAASATAGAEVAYRHQLGSRARLRVGAEGSFVLRPLWLSASDDEQRLAGVWLSTSLGVEFF